MPNVMGREFPYTPQGMAAAEQYKQAMGMRDGGMMGFRPIGYANGSPGVPVTDSMAVIRELQELELTGTTPDVIAFIEGRQRDLARAVEEYPEFASYLNRMLTRFASESAAPQPAVENRGDVPYTGVLPGMRMPPEGGDQLLIQPPPEMAPPQGMAPMPEMSPPQEMAPPQGMAPPQPFRGGGIASLRRY